MTNTNPSTSSKLPILIVQKNQPREDINPLDHQLKFPYTTLPPWEITMNHNYIPMFMVFILYALYTWLAQHTECHHCNVFP